MKQEAEPNWIGTCWVPLGVYPKDDRPKRKNASPNLQDRRSLSVTRHRDASEEEIWEVGNDVVKQLNRTIYGRADIQAVNCRIHSLRVKAKPLPNNPNHADIEGWPAPKADKKVIALELAASASQFIPVQ